MPDPISVLAELLRTLRPALNPGIVTFCVMPPHLDLASVPAIGMFREAEGVTVIVRGSGRDSAGAARCCFARRGSRSRFTLICTRWA